MPLEPKDHCVEPVLARAEADRVHEGADEVGWYCHGRRGRLTIHGGENDREHRSDCWRLAHVEVGVKVHFPAHDLRDYVHPRLALRDVEFGAVEVTEPLGKGFEFLGILNERLHLLLASHGPKEPKHAIDRWWDGSWGRILHGVKANRMKRSLWMLVVIASACDRTDSGDIVATGTLEIIEVDVAPLVTARVERVLIEDGDSVRTGDTLAILSQPSSSADVEQRAARVGATRAGLEEARAGSRAPEIGKAQAELRVWEAEAAKLAADATRARRLYEAGAVAQQQLESALTASREAAARRDAARQSLLLLRLGTRPERIEGARSEVAGAEAQLSAIRATVDAMTLVAPVNGVVLSRNAEPGETVLAGQSAVTLGESARPWVRVYVSALDVPGVKVGSAVRAKVDGLPGRRFSGRILSVNTKAEFTPRVALTEDERADMMFGVKVELDDRTGALKPGLPVTVTIPKGKPDT